jgi:hypothetical protein
MGAMECAYAEMHDTGNDSATVITGYRQNMREGGECLRGERSRQRVPPEE